MRTLNHAAFRNPAAKYRPMPFWGLNDDLSDDVLREQIAEMHDKGWGGFFTHARYGLETPYLGHEYMDRMRTVVDAAAEHGLEAWIYDEHPFPAGTAGGLVTAPDRDLRHKVLVMRLHNRLTPIDPDEARGYFGVTLDGDGVPVAVRRIEDPESDRGDEHHYLHFHVWTEPLHQGFQPGFSNYDDNIIHGFASSDNLDPRAADKFIDVTYRRFQEAVGDRFGTTVKGGFSDIPVYNWNYASPHPSVPWTTGFERHFQERCGYDLLPHLPSLFFDLGDFRRIRIDFWRTASELFVESFTKRLAAWCERNGLIYTAHYWGEETLHWQVPWTGDVMAHFAHHHYVGMDHSIRNIEDPLGIKQAATVAEQLGKPRMVAETYGMAGNSLSHEERKWIGDWEYALGANFLVPYVALYSFRGRRKRDEPSSLFIQQAYWRYERTLYDYYGRLSYALTAGRRVVDTLVLQPLSTAWAMYQPNNDYPQVHRPDPLAFEGAGAKLFAYNEQWMELCDRLLATHHDFHVGNEAVMAQFGRVEGGRLVVGEYGYRAVVVPASTTWSETTVRLLREFAAGGGTVIAVAPVPTLIDGVPADSVLPEQTVVVGDAALALGEHLEKDIDLPDSPNLLYQHRRADGTDIYFIANTSLTESFPGTPVRIPGTGAVELWDALTGERFALSATERDGWLAFELDFHPVSSYLLVRVDHADDELAPYRPVPTSLEPYEELGGGWRLELADPNVLLLDYAEVQVDGGPWSERLPMWKAFRRVKQGGIGSTYTVRFAFDVRERPGPLSLLVETPEKLTVRVNGREVDTAGGSWWLDPSFRTFDISDLVRVGGNTVEYTGRLGVGTDVECCMILGDMSVGADLAIGVAPAEVPGVSLPREGYPFFTGRAFLRKTFTADRSGPVYLTFDKVDATFARVRVNGDVAGDLPWKPYTLEITDLLRDGDNELEVELVTTRHNLFGPHHDRRGDVTKFCAPHIWTNEVTWTDDYYFSPVGVTGAKLARASERDRLAAALDARADDR